MNLAFDLAVVHIYSPPFTPFMHSSIASSRVGNADLSFIDSCVDDGAIEGQIGMRADVCEPAGLLAFNADYAAQAASNYKERAMSQSPGHQQDPSHQVREERVKERMKVVIGGEEIASSDDVIAVHETGCPVRIYFPRGAVKSAALQDSSLTTECLFKGTARYFNLVRGDHTLANAIWSYEDPYDEHRDLRGRLAFYDDKYPDISVMPEA